MSSINESNFSSGRRLPLGAGLWLAQLLLAGVYLTIGIAVLVLPVTQIVAIAPWAGHMSEAFLRFIGSVDLAAGLGVLLPSVTRIAPGLTVLTALCSAALQALAILSYALFGALPAPLLINLAVLALSLFVAWGRSGRALIAPRWQDRRMSAIDAFARGQADGSEDRSKARRPAMARGRESHGSKVFGIQRGLRDAPFIARARKSRGSKAA